MNKIIKMPHKGKLTRFGKTMTVGLNLTIKLSKGGFEPVGVIYGLLDHDETRELRRILRVNGFHKHAEARRLGEIYRDNDVA